MFSDAEKGIFPYNNGQSDLYADPLAVNRKLLVAFSGDIEAALTAGYAPEGKTNGATQAVIDGVRDAFGMLPFDPTTGTGATDAMVLRILSNFSDFMIEKKL